MSSCKTSWAQADGASEGQRLCEQFAKVSALMSFLIKSLQKLTFQNIYLASTAAVLLFVAVFLFGFVGASAGEQARGGD